jgi:hypothetical protein
LSYWSGLDAAWRTMDRFDLLIWLLALLTVDFICELVLK